MREELSFGTKQQPLMPHPPAEISDIVGFLEGGIGPRFQYLQIDFVTTADGVQSHWNQAAAALFSREFLRRVYDAYFPPDIFDTADLNEQNIQSIFLGKLRYFRKLYQDLYFGIPRDEAQILRAMSRKISRRVGVSRLCSSAHN